MSSRLGIISALALKVGAAVQVGAIDFNLDGLGDVWTLVYEATNLAAAADTDGDGVPNGQESTAGTDPWDAGSYPAVTGGEPRNGALHLEWYGAAGKNYELLSRSNLFDSAWNNAGSWVGGDSNFLIRVTPAAPFHAFGVSDRDTDGDGLFDWEELKLGLNVSSSHTYRASISDSNKVRRALRATNHVAVIALDDATGEAWPEAGLFAIRRTGNVNRVTVPFTLGGSAAAGADYTAPPAYSVILEPGVQERWIEIRPLTDAIPEPDETVVLSLGAGPNYLLSGATAATVTIADASAPPGVEEASRFLVQTTFGPTTQAIAEVRALGLAGWITNQMALPPTYLRPHLDIATNAYEYPGKLLSWWDRAVLAPDQFRQRMAFALSQIFVISDFNGTLDGNVAAMISYYDMLLRNSFGNFRDLLRDVTLHPCMGVYSSHLGNRKPIPEEGLYPDENYAREIMQLFTIGLWELNPDGSRILSNGAPVRTYGNFEITQFARVFTGLSYGTGDTNLWWEFFWPGEYDLSVPMKSWQQYHDTDPKTLLRGTVLPAGQAAMVDVEAALDNLFHHPNTGPFIARRLIQRFTTSNPGTGYVARVAAVFANNGLGVRGDLAAVARAILLDPDARDPARMDDPAWGKQREPYIRYVSLARAFNARAPNGFYEMWWLDERLGMQPMSSPSVFNFYLPDYQPAGPVRDAGLVAPEFQITTAVTGISVPNQVLTAVQDGMNRWPGDEESTVALDFTPQLALAGNADALLRHLDELLTYGRLRPEQHRILREAIERIPATDPIGRVEMAVYLIATSPEFCILK